MRWVTEVDAHHYDGYRRAGVELWTWTVDLPPGRVARGEVTGRDAVYAWGSAGHNTLIVDGAPHDARGLAPLTDYRIRRRRGPHGTAAFDLADVLNGPGDRRPLAAAARVVRGRRATS